MIEVVLGGLDLTGNPRLPMVGRVMETEFVDSNSKLTCWRFMVGATTVLLDGTPLTPMIHPLIIHS